MRRAPTGLYHRELPAPDAPVRLRALGVAGFVIDTDDRTLVLDPYLTRPSLVQLLGPLRPHRTRLRHAIPRAHDVLVGHSHVDHVLDAPEVCAQTGARLIGSASVCMVGRAAGLPESQMLCTQGDETLQAGEVQIRGIPSLHSPIAFGRVALPGPITEPPPWPPRAWDLRCGLVLDWQIEACGVRLLHIDTARWHREALKSARADVLCLCAYGLNSLDDVTEAVRLTGAHTVVPCHWEVPLGPPEREQRLLPGVDLPAMGAAVRAAGARFVVLPYNGVLGIEPR